MLLEKTWDYITAYRLIRPGEKILVGFSGGADSLCLLLLLQELGKRHGFFVEAVHVNHQLRGSESDGDQMFAEAVCNRLEVRIHCFSVPVEAFARETGMGIEEAGREARLKIFRQCMEECGAVRIALAHHKSDQAETVLFRMARGSSLGGLSGIRPLQDRVIHPLLFAEKEEILAELAERGEDYRTDSSNLTDHYTRNSIRNRLLPLLEERVNARSIGHIADAAEDIAEADLLMRDMAEVIAGRCIICRETEVLVKPELLKEPAILQRYVLMDALAGISGSRKNLGREQIRQMQDLLQGKTGREYALPGRLEAVRFSEGLVLRKKEETGSISAEEKTGALQSVEITGEGEYRFGNWQIHCEFPATLPSEIPEKTYTKWLDYDKIKDSLIVRNRKSGDFLLTRENGGRKKLKSYFIDEKIPVEQRAKIPLLASDSRIFWVVGHRISEDCKVTAQTKHVLKITVSEGVL